MDKSRQSGDKGKGIAKEGKRSRPASPDQDPRCNEGYMAREGTLGSSSKRVIDLHIEN